MAEAGNSCSKWKSILSKNLSNQCKPNCFEPCHGPCPDMKIIDVANLEPEPEPPVPDPLDQPECPVRPIIKFEEPVVVYEPEIEGPVRHIVDTKSICDRCANRQENGTEKTCTIWDAQNDAHKNNFCCSECRPLSTLLHLNEWTKRPRQKPTYKHSIFLDSNTFTGRVFPMKMRIRRIKKNCLDCGKELYFREPVTENDNVIVLENCCDVKVYSHNYIENWHRVPIVSITGDKRMKKRTLNEVCKLEPKKKPIEVVPEIKPIEIIPPKPAKGKGKGKKGKK